MMSARRGWPPSTSSLTVIGRIGWAGGPAGVDTAERRQDGFRDAMAAAGLELDPAWIVRAEYTAAGGAEAAAAILRSPVHPTAIVAADANEGLGVWHALHAHGLSVPGDVSLIAIHKLPAEDYRIPSMTCVEMPLRQARAARRRAGAGPALGCPDQGDAPDRAHHLRRHDGGVTTPGDPRGTILMRASA